MKNRMDRRHFLSQAVKTAGWVGAAGAMPLNHAHAWLAPHSRKGRGLPKKTSDSLTDLGVTTNLKICLDAGDSSSYTSGQTWSDVSGTGSDFYRGTTTGAEGSDPTFNGTAGGMSSREYWSLDGGDWFTYKAANPAWINNLHKDAALLTVTAWVYLNLTSTAGLFGTAGNSLGAHGMHVSINTSGAMRVFVANGSGTAVASLTSTLTVPAAQWVFLAYSLNEATGPGGGIFQCNGAQETFNSTYTSPSSSAASYTVQIGALSNNQLPMANGSRIGSISIWEGTALSATNLNLIYNATRYRYGV